MSAIFLSHSSRDGELAAEIKRWLAGRDQLSVFLDFDPESGIPAGRNWERELYQQLRRCRAVVFLATESSAASRWCFAELVEARSQGKAVIPVRAPGSAVDPILHDVQIIDLDCGREEAFARLSRALETSGVGSVDRFTWDATRSPYPGLLAFQEKDAAVFFGRETEVGQGIDLLNQARWATSAGIVMVLGASGCGKSSLLRAGLLPSLRRDPDRWLVVGPFKPGDDPMRELAGALAEAFDTLDWRSIRERLEAATPGGRRDPLSELADDLRMGSGRRDARVLVAVDQFEELLGRLPGHPSYRVVELLRVAAASGDGAPMVLGTLRSDFLGELQKHPAMRGAELSSLTLGPMLDEGLIRIVEEPARVAGIDLGPGLTAAVVRDADGGNALPLVAFALRELYVRFGEGGLLTLEQYQERLGGVRGAVARVAESVLPDADRLKGVEPALRDAFLRMARFDDQDRLVRTPVAWSDLPASVHPHLQRFVEARLLTSRDEDGDATVEVAHEALFTAWDKLARWLEEGREALAVRREVRHATRQWEDSGRVEDDLWRGGRLQRAVELRGEGRLPLSGGEVEFVEASEAAERARWLRQRRRRRVLIATTSLVAVVTTALALAALWGMRRASEQRARAEVQAAKAVALHARSTEHQIDQALLLAVESARTLAERGEPGDLYEARTSLFALLTSNPGLETTLHGHEQWIEGLAFGWDGRSLVSGGADGRLLVWDLATREAKLALDLCDRVARPPAETATSCGERIKALAFSRDGTRLAAGTEKGQVVVWATSDYRPEAVLQESGSVLGSLDFRPFGRELAAGDIDGRIQIWDLSAPDEPPRELLGHSGNVSRVKFDPSGERLWSAGRDGTIRSWDLASGEGTIFHRSDRAFYSMAVDRSGAIAVGSVDGGVRAWNPDGTPRFDHPLLHSAQVRDLTFTPDGATLISAGLDGVVELLDAKSGRSSEEVSLRLQAGPCEDDCEPTASLLGHVQGAYAVAVGPDGGTLATGAGDGTIRVWRRDLAPQRTVRTAQRTGLTSVAFRGGDLVATGAQDGLVLLTPLRGGVRATSVGAQKDEIWGLALSPDRRYLAASGGKLSVQVWALDALDRGEEGAAGKRPATLQLEHREHRAWIWSAAFSPDSRLLATSDEQGFVHVWNVPERRPVASFETGGSSLAVAFEPSGHSELAVTGKDGSIGIWDPEKGDRLQSWPAHAGPVVDLAYSHGGARLASAGNDGTVRIWSRDGGAWRERPDLVLGRGEAVGVRSVAFSGDDTVLASGDLQGQIQLWNATTGEPLFGIAAHRGAVLGLEIEDGELLSSGEDRTVGRWPIDLVDSLGQASRLACGLANRNLSLAEWEEFFGVRPYHATCGEKPSPGPPQRTTS